MLDCKRGYLCTNPSCLEHMIKPPDLDFDSLLRRVENRLCEIGQLEPNQFPVTQRKVVKSGRSVGIYYCLHGPRSVKLTAICDLVRNTIVYYGSDGIRADRQNVTLGKLAAAL